MKKPVNHQLKTLLIAWSILILSMTVSSFPGVLFFYYYLKINNPLKYAFVLPFFIFVFIIFFALNMLIMCFAAKIVNTKHKRKKISKEQLALRENFRIQFNSFFIFYSMTLQPGRLKNWVAKRFGMKLGENVKICKETRIYNPDYVEIGDNTLIGSTCLLTAHMEEKGMFEVDKIKIGRNCLIGGGTWIFPGVEIGDNVVVGARSLIPKGRKLPSNSVWAGVPIRRIK
jgi:acetyltransferase-like isoleucine patch superfamily enzyme